MLASRITEARSLTVPAPGASVKRSSILTTAATALSIVNIQNEGFILHEKRTCKAYPGVERDCAVFVVLEIEPCSY